MAFENVEKCFERRQHLSMEKHKFYNGRVSVVTPVYNGESHLPRMLDSILGQTYDFIDMILVDDGSCDRTAEVAESYREKFDARGYGYRVILSSHNCASAAINQGLPYVTGEYLVWPDSDDVLEPESIKKRVGFLQNHPQYQCVRSLSYYFNAETGELAERADEKTGDLTKEDLFWDILESKTFVCCGCYMLRTERFFEIYPERHIPEYAVGQNFQMLLPFMYNNKCPTIPEKLYGVFVREGSHSRRQLTRIEELKKYRDYEELIDQIAEICHITDKESKNHITFWKANRRRQIAWKHDQKALLITALFQLYRCRAMSFRQMAKDILHICIQVSKEKKQEFKQQVSANEVNSVHFCRKKIVALTFDASWGNAYTSSILDKLKQYDVKVTFFISGIWIEKYPEDYRNIFKNGHELGNHSYKHPHMRELSDDEVLEEINKTERLSNEIIDKDGRLFRFPYGESDKRLLQLIEKNGLLSVNWTVDSKDWMGIAPEKICSNVIKNDNLTSGAIILMHNSGEHTVEALDLLIPALKEMGYKIVTVSELLNSVLIYRYKMQKLKRNKIE